MSNSLPGDELQPFDGMRVPQVRASDIEREQVVMLLNEACVEGRLTLEELSGRVGAAYAAVTRADLVPLTADLPVAGQQAPLAERQPPLPLAPTRHKRKWLVCVMSENKRRGHWRLSDRTAVVTIMGESVIDLRQAVIESSEIALTLYMMMGSQKVIVPEGVEVEVTGFVFMGEKRVTVADTRPRPGVPRLHIRVLGTMGEVKIETG